MLTGCVTDGRSSGKDTAEETTDKGSSDGAKKFAAFVPTMTNPYWVSELGQLEADIEADGGTLDIFDAQSDQSKQISQVEDAISAGYDLFFAITRNPSLMKTPKRSWNAGILTVRA